MTRPVRRPLPADPMIRQLAQAAMSRRRLLGTGVGVGLGAAGLAGCAPPPLPPAKNAELELPDDLSAKDKRIVWANWTAYLDVSDDEKSNPSLDAFTKRTGIKVDYKEEIEDNDTYYAKYSPQMRERQQINRDIMTLTDWMTARVMRDQLCQPLEMINMPHVAMNMLAPLKEVPFDPGRQFSVTWQSGFAGIGYNKKKVGRELKSLDDLWADDLKGKVTVLSEWRDTVALVMQNQGVDITSDWGRTEFEKAVDFIQQKIDQGYIRKVKGNSYMEDLTRGDAYAGITWSGDVFILAYDTKDPSWTFTIPESGGTLWSDNLLVPITSQHRGNVQKLIDYYYEPEVAAEVAAYVNYVSPVIGAKEVLAKSDPELAESPFIFPSESYIKNHNIQAIRSLSPEEDQEFGKIWSQKAMGI